MDFKYTGPGGHKSPDLVIYGIMDEEDELEPNQILKIPDENERLISMLDTSGYFQKVKKDDKTAKKINKHK